MSNQFASGRHALAECDVCGFRYKLKNLKSLIIKGKTVNILACPECWTPDQPQLHLGEYQIFDPQALRNPRPDNSYYVQSGSRRIQWGWAPVGGSRNFDVPLTQNDLVSQAMTGMVTITVT